jgi:hypothetical protein
MRILFICHKNDIYGNSVYTRRSSGLFNSTSFIVAALSKRGIHAHIVEVDDNNDIDRECFNFKPDAVVIEALWVVPEKFEVLKRYHPKVKWFIHLHSDMPFLALEGIAMEWVIDCQMRGIGIIANSKEAFDALAPISQQEKLFYLPNVYLGTMRRMSRIERGCVNVGCFGAVRPLKNHLLQALAAIQFAREKNKCLKFHINVGRIETGGEPVLKNMRKLFRSQPGCRLVEHAWFEPDDFLQHLQDHIDIGLQVSLTETFNVVTADYVTAGVPIVVSKEVKWVSGFSTAIDNSLPDIVRLMHRAWKNQWLVWVNQLYLKRSSLQAQELWFEFCRNLS